MLSSFSSSGESLDNTSLNRSLLVGSKYEDLGNLNAALKYYQDLLRRFDHNPDIFFRIGHCYHQMGRLDLAVSNYLMALSIRCDHQKARKALRSARDEQALMGGAYGSLVESFTTAARSPLGDFPGDGSMGRDYHFLSNSAVRPANEIWDQLMTIFIRQSPADYREGDGLKSEKFLAGATTRFAHTANEYKMLVELKSHQSDLVLSNIQILNPSDLAISESLFWIGNDFLMAFNQDVAKL